VLPARPAHARTQHEAEELNTPSMVEMGDALRDPSLPMKIGLNLWFTDRRHYPRPEMQGVRPPHWLCVVLLRSAL
jgi:hypothetical protein